jgi:hypothetical protein
MNDTELDEILDSWTAPPAPASLRERVRNGFSAAMEQKTISAARVSWKTVFARRARKGLLAVAVVALGALVLVVIQAVSQTLGPVPPPVQVPFVVESEFVQYASDGSPQVAMHTTSYSRDGNEVVLSRTLPGNPIGTAIARTLDTGSFYYLVHIAPRPHLTPEMAERIRAARADPNHISLLTGCDRPTCWITSHYGFGSIGDARIGCAKASVVGHETILNYPTVAAQRALGNSNQRMTLWMAPDLGCFALKETLEERGADGAFRLVSGRQAVKVTWKP